MKTKAKMYSLCILFLLIGNNLFSQNTFKIVIPGIQSRGAAIISLDSTFLFMDLGWESIIRECDNFGNLKYTHNFNSDLPGFGHGLGSKSCMLRDNNNMILLLLGLDTNYRRCITSFNMQSNSFNWITGFNINAIPNFPYVISQGINKNYIITTHNIVSYQNYQCTPIVVVTDSMGQLINSYQFENHFGVPSFTYQLNDNSYITGVNYRDTIGPSLVRFDSTGNVIWAKKYFSNKGLFYSSVKNNDGSLTIIGSPDTTNYGTYRSQQFLMKVDTAGNVLWNKVIGDSVRSFKRVHASQVKKTNDGGYVITGYVCDSTVSLYGGSDLIIIKTDSNGDTLWTRTHGNKYTEDGGQDISQTPDGGYIMTGFSSSDQFGLTSYDCYIIFKTDSLGMTSTHCQEFNTPIAVSNLPVNDSNITLTITTGLISAIPSTVYDSADVVPQLNGCGLSATWVDEQADKLSLGYKAIPNPTQGVFILKNSINNTESITISIYDMLGHEIVRINNIKDTEPKIDLTAKPAGIYFVKIIGGSKVEVVKVVVE